MLNLEKKLHTWVEKDFISAEQEKKILTYEATNKSFSWILYSFITLGAAVIGIGIIALIAANWYLIPNHIKLINDFVIMFLLSFCLFHFDHNHRPLLAESLLFLLMICILGSIGLISQIYQIQGTLGQALLFWATITFPLTMFAQRRWVPLFWTILFLIGLLHTWADLFEWNDGAIGVIPYLALPLICLVTQQLFSYTSITHNLSLAFRVCALWVGLIAILVADVTASTRFGIIYLFDWHILLNESFIVYCLLTFAVIFGICRNTSLSHTRRSFHLLLLAIYTTFLLLDLRFPGSTELIPAIFTILLFTGLAINFAANNDNKKFTLMIALAGLRFLIIYFQVIGSLAMTGIGLIISGVVIIGLTIIITKNMTQLKNWAGVLLK